MVKYWSAIINFIFSEKRKGGCASSIVPVGCGFIILLTGQTGKLVVRTEDLPRAFKILRTHTRVQGKSRHPIFCLLSAGCTKTLKNACARCAMFCKQNILPHAFCKLSSLAYALVN